MVSKESVRDCVSIVEGWRSEHIIARLSSVGFWLYNISCKEARTVQANLKEICLQIRYSLPFSVCRGRFSDVLF